MNSTTFTRPDGLYISADATWPQLAADETLCGFAGGLIPLAPHQTQAGLSWTLAELLHQRGPQNYPLLTALLALEAEVNAIVDNKYPVFPLPGFLIYRSKLSPDKFPLYAIRLPRLRRTHEYCRMFQTDDGFCVAIRLGLHPQLKLAGHVCLAISGPQRSPVRLLAIERRLEQQVLNQEFIQSVVTTTIDERLKPLTATAQLRLVEALLGLVNY
jgi:hypothetical protein